MLADAQIDEVERMLFVSAALALVRVVDSKLWSEIFFSHVAWANGDSMRGRSGGPWPETELCSSSKKA